MAQKELDEQATGNRSLRNPRRRTRPDSESIKVAPRRKRSKISETTFLPRGTPEEEANDAPVTNGNGSRQVSRSYGRNTSVSIASGDIDLAVRGPRSGIKRTTRADASRVLTQNEHYSVKLLSSTPKELQNLHFRGSILAPANLALALTRTKAYIWDYNGHLSAIAAKSVDVPFHVSQHEPLPFGAFVTAAGSSETGLLLASASSGKLVYYDSVERATTLGLFQERQAGIQGSIPGLFAGEKLVQLVNGGPAGYVALFTSGRMAQISLRDSQGKPRIQTQFLYTSEQTTGGLFGSIKNILGAGAWKQTVSTVNSRVLERGQAQVIALLEKGEVRIWDIDWSGRCNFIKSKDFRDEISKELRQMRSVERQGDVEHLVLLDLAILDKTQHGRKTDLITVGSSRPLDGILLVRCGSAGMHTYSLVEFNLQDESFSIVRILDVHADSKTSPDHRERLLVPVSHTALVVLSNAVAVVSLASASSDPEAQLHEASYVAPSPYQDAFYLRSDPALKFSGAEVDAGRSTEATSLLFVDNVGLLRVTTAASSVDPAQGEAAVRSKIEQAVYYGYQDGNVLDLLRASPIQASEEDINEAVLSISDEILHSTSPHFDVPPVSVSSNLAKRAAAASHLAAYIQKSHLDIPKHLKWRLLTNAEKISTGLKLWDHFEAQLNTTTAGKRKATLLNELCEVLSDELGFSSLWPHSSSDDIVRTFFVTQLEHIGRLFPWSRRILQTLYDNGSTAPVDTIRLLSEANDIWLTGLNTAWNFRKDNAPQYGIHLSLVDNETYSTGTLQGVSELWTSTEDLIKELPKLTEVSRKVICTLYEEQACSGDLLKKPASQVAALVDVMCQINLERIAWCKSQENQKLVHVGQKLEAALPQMRHQEIRQLAGVGQTQAGIALAEKYRDMECLTETLVAEAQYLTESFDTAEPGELEGLTTQLQEINAKVASCFERFGDPFSEAFFNEGFYDGNAGRLLSDVTPYNEHMTRWLRKYPDRAKMCWINDVSRVKDYRHASKCLYDVAKEQEHNTWSKKVELSLAKLALYADYEETEGNDQEQLLATSSDIDAELSIADVQDRLYQHVLPEVFQSLDDEAAVQDAMNSLYGPLIAFSTWYELIAEEMSRLLAHQTLDLEQLVDLLTMAEGNSSNIEDQDAGRSETFEAFVAIAAASSQKFPASRLNLMTKLAWKRAFLHENWEGINLSSATEHERDMQEILRSTNTYRAIAYVLDAKATQPDCPMTILEPSATAGAGCHIDDLPAYIPEGLRQGALEENRVFETQLQAMIREQRIEHWVELMITLAKEDLTQSTTSMNGHADGTALVKIEDMEEPIRFDSIGQIDVDML